MDFYFSICERILIFLYAPIVRLQNIFGGLMNNRRSLIFMRYIIMLFMVTGLAVKSKGFDNEILIIILVFVINNQLRFFSLEKDILKNLSFIFEIALTIILNTKSQGYLFTYLILLSMDANTLFEKNVALIYNAAIIAEGIYFSINYSVENKFMNVGLSILFMVVLYFTRNEKDEKLKAQDLYDRLRISEEKLKKANRELELYAASVEEITLLRERNRISREIHDSVGHALSTMVIQLGAVEKMIRSNGEVAEELTKNLRKFTQKSLDEVRLAVREIKPREFNEYEGILHIEELINNFKKMTGIDVRLSFSKEKWSLNSDQIFVIYRIVQEFLSNSLRHGKASIVHIVMAFTNQNLAVTLKDNGLGCGVLVEGVGIKSMRERVNELGGHFEYKSRNEEGFFVRIELNRQEELKAYSGGLKDE